MTERQFTYTYYVLLKKKHENPTPDEKVALDQKLGEMRAAWELKHNTQRNWIELEADLLTRTSFEIQTDTSTASPMQSTPVRFTPVERNLDDDIESYSTEARDEELNRAYHKTKAARLMTPEEVEEKKKKREEEMEKYRKEVAQREFEKKVAKGVKDAIRKSWTRIILGGIVTLILALTVTFTFSGPPMYSGDLGRVDEDTLSLVDERQDPYDERSGE